MEAQDELKVLRLGAERALNWLVISDYRRTNSYACAAVTLENVLEQSRGGYETMSLLMVMRRGLSRAINYIKYNC